VAGCKGKSGRQKKPTALKILQGTYRADRDAESVKFSADNIPPMPKGLHPIAQAEWNELTPLCVNKGLVTRGDWIAWSSGFRIYSVYLRALETLGDLVEYAESGMAVARPEVWIIKSYQEMVLKWCREFGLTASSRSGMKIDDNEGKDQKPQAKIAKFFNRNPGIG
jgi:phage terminase small subunit